MDHVHLCTALCGLGEIWRAARKHPNFEPAAHSITHETMLLAVQILSDAIWSQRQALQQRDVAILLTAFTSLGLQLDEGREGLSAALADATLADCEVDDAYSIAKVLHSWAMHGFDTLDDRAPRALVRQLSHTEFDTLKPPFVSMVLSALTKMTFKHHSSRLIDRLLNQLKHGSEAKQYMTLDFLHSLLSSLLVLSHNPDFEQGKSLIALFGEAIKLADPSISSLESYQGTLWCFAELGVRIPARFSWHLLKYLTWMTRGVSEYTHQPGLLLKSGAHVAHSLAVADALTISMLEHLVEAFTEQCSEGQAPAWDPHDVLKMHLAVESVQPGPDDHERLQRWQQVKQMIPEAPEQFPAARLLESRVSPDMTALLQAQGLVTSEPGPLGLLYAHISPKHADSPTPVIVDFLGPEDFFKNKPNR